jgi:hypothetical protein
MPFEDLYVFKDRPPDDLYDSRRGDEPGLAGRRVVYRLGVQSMVVEGLPDELQVGRVQVHQAIGPVTTQRTEVVQRPGVPLVFDKVMRMGLQVGHGLPLSVCQIDDTIPSSSITDQFESWRDEALAALGLLAAILDERIAQEPVFEDAVVFDPAGEKPDGMLDVRRKIRNFYPYPVFGEGLEELDRLGAADPQAGPLAAAARWYLRAVQGGPRADAVVFFWTAIEALLGPADGSKAEQLKAALRDAGADPDPDDFQISPARLSWIRGEVVHKGKEQPDDLVPGYYLLDAITRLLLRHRLGAEAPWPLMPAPEVFDSPLRERIAEAWTSPPVVNLEFVQAGADASEKSD